MSSYTLGAGVPFQCPGKVRAYKAHLQKQKISYRHGKEIFVNFLKPCLLLIELLCNQKFWNRKDDRIVPFSSSDARGVFILPIRWVCNPDIGRGL